MENFWVKNYQESVPETINPDKFTSLTELLGHSLQEFSSEPALANLGHTLSYAKLDELSRNLSAYFQSSLGLKKGDKCAVMMPNVLQYMVTVVAALRAGLVVVNVNPLYTASELHHVLQDSGAKVIVVLANFANTVEKAMAKGGIQLEQVIVTEVGDLFPLIKRSLINFVVKYVKNMVPKFNLSPSTKYNIALNIGKQLPFNTVAINSQDLAFLQYTGGTTGPAKGAALTHRNMVANVLQVCAWIEEKFKGKDNKNIITALPLYHIFSLTANGLSFFKLGGCNVLITNPRDIPGFVKELKRQPFAAISGVNTLFNALLHNKQFKEIDFSDLILAIGGGMALQAAVAEKWQQVTGTALLEGYGLTEASPVVSIVPMNTKEYKGSIGLPVPSTIVSIRDEAGKEVPLGETGEIWVKGPQVMQGYWNNQAETDKVLQDGWLSTGDIARFDQEGYLYIVDRKKDMILVSGFNVFPNEVEDVLVRHQNIREAAVVGVVSKEGNERVKAFIVTNDGQEISREEIMQHCKEYLTAYKIPKLIEFRSDLPKTNVGKILRRALREENKVE